MKLRPVLLLALAAPLAQAATVLEYDIDGRCETPFRRMAFDGLYARVDTRAGDGDMSTLFDDGEQLMTLLMHDTRQTLVMESDDDAVDFQGDVGRSTLLYSNNQMKKLTGMSQDAMMAQAQAALSAACPELADIGFSDPDFAAAQARCTEKMGGQSAFQMDPQFQKDLLASMQGKTPKPRAAPAEPVRWSTTQVERGESRKTIAGIECAVETTRRGETVLLEECVVPVEQVPLDATATRRLRRMMKVGEGLGAGIASVNPAMNPDAGKPPVLALERTCYEGGQRSGQATLRIERNVSVPASDFSVPSDYEPLLMELPGSER